MEREKATVWITQKALTEGIYEALGEIAIDQKKPYFTFSQSSGKNTLFVFVPHLHWHRSKVEAIAHAEKMRKAKIASLKKQIEKLENIRFE